MSDEQLRKPHLSASQLSMLSRCGLQYFYRYVLGERRPPGVAAHVGSGVHASIERNLRAKLGGWGLLSLDEVADAAVDATRKRFAEEPPMLDDDERALGADKVEGAAIDTAASLALLHAKELAPVIDPVAVEQEFRIVLDGFPYDLLGYKDIVEPRRIRDTKTSSKTPPKDAAYTSLQLTLYHLDSVIRGDDVTVALDYLVSTKTPKAVTLSSCRNEQDHRKLLARVETAARVIEAGAFAPAAPDAWCCSPRWCGWYDRCPSGSGARTTVALIDPKNLVRRAA